MIARTFIFVVAFFACRCCLAQFSIEDCYRKAQANYPLIRQYDLIEKTKEYNLSNVAKGYLPQMTFSAQATYQSDVTKIPFDAEQLGFSGIEIPTVSKDQYKVTLDVSQNIWDGGNIRSQKEAIRTRAEVEQRNMDVNIYAVNDRVNQIYFGILLAEAQIEQNRLLQDELQRNCDKVMSYMRNGIANQSDYDALKVDLLKAKQNESQLVHTRRAYVAMLARLIGEEISEQTTFVKPQAVRSLGGNNRPELSFYEAQIRDIQANDDRILENDFRLYYMAGVKLSWNIGNFYTRKNDLRKNKVNIRSVEVQRNTFLFNTSLDVIQKNTAIDKYFDQLKYDDEIIALRNSVKRASETKMANGTLSGTELTRDINAEQSAIQDKILHEIELLMAIYNLKYVVNN